jgi:hypothetical protein
MIRLGIISDTHSRASVPEWVLTAFAGVDQILHAGDITSSDVCDELSTIAPCLAVRGNMDDWECRYPVFRHLTIEGHELALAHFSETALAQIAGETGIAVFGHTHLPVFRREHGIWLLNPGSPSLPRGKSRPSVAILEISGENVHAMFRNPPQSSDE